jgi:hypothetical protein
LSKKEQKKLEDDEFERVLKEMGVAETKTEDNSAVKTETHEVDEKK